VNYCHLQTQKANEIFDLTKKLCKDNGITAHNVRSHSGLLRNLVIRYSKLEDNYMVILITNPTEDKTELEFVDLWAKSINDLGYVASTIYATKERNSPVKIIEYKTLYGKDYLLEDILGVKFQISPFSFFQTNPIQLDNFIKYILEFSELNSDEILWDLYCGTGSISLPAASSVKKVIGLELVEDSIEDAKKNAKLNNFENTEFYAVDLHTKNLPEIFSKLEKPDNIIIDPPRAGIHNNVIDHLLELEVPKITYVSCNPTTMARDCELLSAKYDIIKIKPVDMFPQTYHIEAIAQLRLKK
jgi:23S rRNA (uracil1939-C5)-methyltransferase